MAAKILNVFRRSSKKNMTAPKDPIAHSILASSESNVELSPLDQYCTTFATIPWTTFYSYDIIGDKLKSALEIIAKSYPVVCGRLKSKEGARMELVVSPDKGFSYTEEFSSMSVAEAVTKAHVEIHPAQFPSFAKLPFFAAEVAAPVAIDQDVPLFAVKLVHYSDGCSLAATIHHAVADARRLAELMVDISAAYRGEKLRDVDHDRSQAWPDALLKKVPIGMNPEDFPHTITTPYDSLPVPSFEDETYTVESIYLPMDEIDALKKKITEGLKEVEFVSQVDVVTTLVWMLQCESEARRQGKTEIKTSTDLAIQPSFCLYMVDLVSETTPLITNNFFGNAYFGTLATVPAPEEGSTSEKNILETATMIATSMRAHVLQMKEPAAQVMCCIAVYKQLTEMPQFPPVVSGISSFYKMPFEKMDYGHGCPVYNYLLPTHPFCDVWGSIAPMGNDNGIVVHKIVRDTHKDTTLDSIILKELVPGYSVISQKTSEEIAKMIT